MEGSIGSIAAQARTSAEASDEYAEAVWKLFDLVVAEPDAREAIRLAEDGAEAIGAARGISGATIRKYRQRGRDMLLFQHELAVMPRAENPLSIVARLRNPRHRSNPTTDLDLDLINAVLNANTVTQNAVIELVTSGRLRLG